MVDADGDGWPDLHITTAATHRLFVNDRAGGFQELDLGDLVAPTPATDRTATRARHDDALTAAPDSTGTPRGRSRSTTDPVGGPPPPVQESTGPFELVRSCASSVVDQAGGMCLETSSIPSPGHALEVAGKVVSGSGNTPDGPGATIGGGSAGGEERRGRPAGDCGPEIGVPSPQ